MRTLWLLGALLFALVMPQAKAFAALPQLSFDGGASILRNPSDEQFVLRSANIDQVQLTLYHVAQPELLNQISAARATQSVTEEGMRDRVLAEAPAVWRARFVLGNSQTPEPQTIPISIVSAPLVGGSLPPGVYMLAAQALASTSASTPSSTPVVVQWFHVGNLAVHVAPVAPGNLVMTTHRNAAVPVGLVRLSLLNNKGLTVEGAPRDWRTDSSGAVFWSGGWPKDAVLLRADDGAGNTALLPLTGLTKSVSTKARSRGIKITPAFDGNSVPSGATAAFDVAAQDENGEMLQDSLRYEFARITNSYRWIRDAENMWQSQTVARPTVIERGALRPGRGVAAGQAVRLLLAVTEGRFRLTVSTPDGTLRQSYEFTAGWWRSLPVDQDEMALTVKLKTTTQLEISALDRAETGAPRWAVVWRPDGPETRAGNSPILDLPADRVAGQPLVAGLCVPGRDTAPVVCAGALVEPDK